MDAPVPAVRAVAALSANPCRTSALRSNFLDLKTRHFAGPAAVPPPWPRPSEANGPECRARRAVRGGGSLGPVGETKHRARGAGAARAPPPVLPLRLCTALPPLPRRVHGPARDGRRRWGKTSAPPGGSPNSRSVFLLNINRYSIFIYARFLARPRVRREGARRGKRSLGRAPPGASPQRRIHHTGLPAGHGWPAGTTRMRNRAAGRGGRTAATGNARARRTARRGGRRGLHAARPTRRGETPVRALPGASPRPAAAVREAAA